MIESTSNAVDPVVEATKMVAEAHGPCSLREHTLMRKAAREALRLDPERLMAYEHVTFLLAEVERLRAGGAWVERVEYQRAMKRERDGECICNTGPDTDGPDEFCPWHGRPYSELVEILNRQSTELSELQSGEEA